MAPWLWYRVRDLDAARTFYCQMLGFDEAYVDEEDRWARLDARERRGRRSPRASPKRRTRPARVDVADVKAEAERLREQGVQVGTVLEIPGTIRLLDVFDPDGNRLQLSQDL